MKKRGGKVKEVGECGVIYVRLWTSLRQSWRLQLRFGRSSMQEETRSTSQNYS
jgi:hypothetical protein